MNLPEAIYVALVMALLICVAPAVSLLWGWLQADRPDATPWE